MNTFCATALLGLVASVSTPIALADSVTPAVSPTIAPIVHSASIFLGSIADTAPLTSTNGEPLATFDPGFGCGSHGVLCLPSIPEPTSVSAPIDVTGSNGSSLAEQTGVLAPIGNTGSLTQSVAVVVAPEPNSLILLATGLLAAAGLFFRRRAIV